MKPTYAIPSQKHAVPDLASIRLSIPSPGRPLLSVVEPISSHIRKTTKFLADNINNKKLNTFQDLFSPRLSFSDQFHIKEDLSVRTAWALINIWFLANTKNHSEISNFSFEDAENWFFGDKNSSIKNPLTSLFDKSTLIKAQSILSNIKINETINDLYPYILDPIEPGDRLTVLKNPNQMVARKKRKSNGIYYTPSDVAEFISGKLIRETMPELETLLILDPACGSGVFLKSAIEIAKSKGVNLSSFVTNNIFGVDKNILSVEICCYVLLKSCLSSFEKKGLSPFLAWHLIRLNIKAVDSLKIQSPNSDSKQNELKNNLLQEKTKIKKLLIKGSLPATTFMGGKKIDLVPTNRIPFESVFPDAKNGFDILLGNPPYCSNDENENIFLNFTELMWRFTKPTKSFSGLVVPMSIAYNRGQKYQICRDGMLANGGNWKFSFYDRQPHGLFGEEVKTRNSIIFRFKNIKQNSASTIQTSAMRKCTSRTRVNLFSSVKYVDLGNIDIKFGIPKLGNSLQRETYLKILKRTDFLTSEISEIDSCLPEKACSENLSNVLYIAGTAYNFINVFLKYDLKTDKKNLSQSAVTRLVFKNEASRFATYAIMNSRLVYWLWHIQGDGFHVTRQFIQTIPFSNCLAQNSISAKILANAGKSLWNDIQPYRLISKNGGKQTISYNPFGLETTRDTIDRTLIKFCGFNKDVFEDLKRFVLENAIVDQTENRRLKIHSFFEKEAISANQ